MDTEFDILAREFPDWIIDSSIFITTALEEISRPEWSGKNDSRLWVSPTPLWHVWDVKLPKWRPRQNQQTQRSIDYRKLPT